MRPYRIHRAFCLAAAIGQSVVFHDVVSPERVDVVDAGAPVCDLAVTPAPNVVVNNGAPGAGNG